ncbi:hypothetical protein WAI453_004625 [Rhynchosporium graminicola]
MNPSHGDVKTGDVRYNEAATFSDANPPTKNDTVVGISSLSINSDESGDELKKNPILDPDVAEH